MKFTIFCRLSETLLWLVVVRLYKLVKLHRNSFFFFFLFFFLFLLFSSLIHTYIYTNMSMIIPTNTASTSSCSYSSHSTIDTSAHKDTQKSKQELWHIIEKQRAIIQELQQALVDVTYERDDLLLKSKSIPTPPPRSPYRSNNHGETPDSNYTQKSKPIPTTTTTTLQSNKVNIKVKSVHSNRFVLALMDHSNLELWAVEKTFTDLIHLNHTVKFV